MPGQQPVGVELLSAGHAAGIERLASDPAIAGALGMALGGADFIARADAARAAGTAYAFAIVDRREVLGLCTLGDTATQIGTLGVWVAQAFRGRGHGTFAVARLLEFAFHNLRLEGVRATDPGTDPAVRRVLGKNGLAASGDGDTYSIDQRQWRDLRHRRALAALHPALGQILEAELAAGNEVLETGGGWPDPDSVFVKLRHRFRTRPSPIPDGVTYTEPSDPHWWFADYSSRNPRHLLAC